MAAAGFQPNFVPLERAKEIYEALYSDIADDVLENRLGYSSYQDEMLYKDKKDLLRYAYTYFPMYNEVWDRIEAIVDSIYAEGYRGDDPESLFEEIRRSYPKLPPLFDDEVEQVQTELNPDYLYVTNPDGSTMLATKEGRGKRGDRTPRGKGKTSNPWIKFIQEKVKRTGRSYRDVMSDPKTKKEYNNKRLR